MSQIIYSSINPATTSGNQLATILTDFKNAIVSGFSGTARPANLQAGGYWVDTTNELSGILLYKIYTGLIDVTVFTVNTVGGTVSLSGVDGQINITKRSADAVGPILEFIKKRIAANGQTLIGDILGEQQFKCTDSTGATVLSARIKAVASDDATITETGAYLVWETTNQDSTSFTEVMSLRNTNLGVGVMSPLYRVHAKGLTGVGSEVEANSTAPAKFTGRKKRATGQVLSGDGIVEFKGNSTDLANAEIQDAFVISVTATENHTAIAHGTKAEFKTKNTGSIVATTKIEMGDVLNFPVGNRTKDVVVGTNATLATNAKIVRSGTGKASVVLGNDATAEGSEPTTLAQLSHRIENFTTAGKPANSISNLGRVIYVTDTNKFEYDTGTAWAGLGGGGGGGGSFKWYSPRGIGPIIEEESEQEIYLFSEVFSSGGTGQYLTGNMKMTNAFTTFTTAQGFLHFKCYTPATTGRYKFELTTTLIKDGVDAFSSIVNQNVTSVEITIAATSNLDTIISLAYTGATGLINGQTVTANDTLKFRLRRIAASTTEDANDIRLVPASTEIYI